MNITPTYIVPTLCPVLRHGGIVFHGAAQRHRGVADPPLDVQRGLRGEDGLHPRGSGLGLRDSAGIMAYLPYDEIWMTCVYIYM